MNNSQKKDQSDPSNFIEAIAEAITKRKCEKCGLRLLDCHCWIIEDIKNNPKKWGVKKIKPKQILDRKAWNHIWKECREGLGYIPDNFKKAIKRVVNEELRKKP